MGKKQKLQCIKFEIYMFVCLSYLNCIMLHEVSLKKNQHTPLQGNPMRFFFFCFLNKFVQKKKKIPGSHPIPYAHPVRLCRRRWELGQAVATDDVWDVETLRVPFVLQCILYKIITFFKHIYRVCTNRKWLQITTRLGKIRSPLYH